MEDKAAALRSYLMHLDPTNPHPPAITPGPYDDNTFEVNHRPCLRGTDPAEILDTADALRAKLITLFGKEARDWDSNFLRIQEFEAKDLQPALDRAKKDLERAAKALPMIHCERVNASWVTKEHPLCRGMLGPKLGQFKVYSEGIQRGKPVKTPHLWRPYRAFGPKKTAEYTAILDDLDRATAEYERLRAKVGAYRTYHNLEPVIKASFDWNRLGDKHDNETAHAYQYIVNALYFVSSLSGNHAEEYAKQLRDAFDDKPVQDLRTADTTDDGEYMVLTEEEADIKVREYIEDSLWAFRASWLCPKYIKSVSAGTLQRMQEELCEDANEAVKALIGDRLPEVIEAAIKADGRGHFLNTYDGKEIEWNGLFIYKMND